VCQDFLYENVERAGGGLENVILTGIGEYLPLSKRLAGKSILGRYGKMEIPSPQLIESRGFHQFQNLIKKYPPNPPKIEINAREDVAVLPYTGGTTGLPKGAGSGIAALLPHIWPSGSHVERPDFGFNAASVYHA
jgi:long-chain acyl-CoA synthetase